MKTIPTLFLTGLCTLALPGAEVTFDLGFDGQSLTAARAAGNPKPVKEIQLEKGNFLPGTDGKSAFILTDKNIAAKEFPGYSIGKNIDLGKGTISFSFKVLKKIPGKKLRFFHLYAPGKVNGAVIIFYSFLDEKGDYCSGIMVNDGKTRSFPILKIPASEITSEGFNRIDFTFDAKELALYLNGRLMDKAPAPEQFAEESAKPRAWASFMMMPVIPSDNDDPDSRAALDNFRIYNAPLSEAEVRKQ